MGLRADVGTDAGLVGFEGCPVDVAGVMIHDQDRPPVASDATLLDTGSTRLVNDTLVSRAPIDIGASVGRMREHAVDRVVGGCNPPELGPGVPRRLLQRKREPLAEQPQPYSPHGAGLCEVGEDGLYHATHRLIGVEEHLAVPLSPDEPDWKAPAELTSCRLVADPALEPGTKHVQLGLAHRALQAQHEPVVEARRVIEAVRVADERVGQPAEIEEPIPVGVVASETADLETEHDADVAERDLGGEVGKATPATDPDPESPRSSSITTTEEAGQPSSTARPFSAYWRSVDSVLCSSWLFVDWRT